MIGFLGWLVGLAARPVTGSRWWHERRHTGTRGSAYCDRCTGNDTGRAADFQ